MQYEVSSAALRTSEKNGTEFIQMTIVKVGSPNDRGFKLSSFNPKDIATVKRQLAEGEVPHIELAAEMEQVTVPFGAAYFRLLSDDNGNVTKNIQVDDQGQPVIHRSCQVRCLYNYKKHPAYYTSGDMKGCVVMQDLWENGVRVSKPAMAFDLDENGLPVKEYIETWSPNERRDQVLRTFFQLAPEKYQQRVTPKPEIADEPVPENPPVSTNPPVNTNPPANTINMNTGGSVPDPMNM